MLEERGADHEVIDDIDSRAAAMGEAMLSLRVARAQAGAIKQDRGGGPPRPDGTEGKGSERGG